MEPAGLVKPVEAAVNKVETESESEEDSSSDDEDEDSEMEGELTPFESVQKRIEVSFINFQLYINGYVLVFFKSETSPSL